MSILGTVETTAGPSESVSPYQQSIIVTLFQFKSNHHVPTSATNILSALPFCGRSSYLATFLPPAWPPLRPYRPRPSFVGSP
mmetsp:Transcript_36498/g.85309  ORF Transcript_36498/g.85309 Transcript_36498/m.85309 type:complete len:82 (+) Transcript_36498:939-1184(+)